MLQINVHSKNQLSLLQETKKKEKTNKGKKKLKTKIGYAQKSW